MNLGARNVMIAGRSTAALAKGAFASLMLISATPLAAEPPLPVKAPSPETIEGPASATHAMQHASKVTDILKRHCARCHDSRYLGRSLPAAGISNILDLEAVARRRDLVRPGHPEGSPLFISMLTRHMPYDVFHELKAGDEPTYAEIISVREWIAALPAERECRGSALTKEQVSAAISSDLQQFDAAARDRRRYLSLRHVVGPCGTRRDTLAHQQAAAKLINLLSLSPQPLRLDLVESDGLLLGFDLADISWSLDKWRGLANEAQRLTLPGTKSGPGTDRQEIEISQRILEVGWLADRVMEPGVYARLLGLPHSLSGFMQAYRLDEESIGFRRDYPLQESQVTGARRSIWRKLTEGRLPFWMAEDFAPEGNGDDETAASGPLQYRAIAPLPNGFPAFALYNRDGVTRSSIHEALRLPELEQAQATGAGLNCIACHGQGLRGFKTSQAEENSAPGNWQAERDNATFYFAMRAAGIPADLKIDGQEPVTALAQKYRRMLGIENASRELERDENDLAEQLASTTGDEKSIARRLLQGLVTREEFRSLQDALDSLEQNGAQQSLPQQLAESGSLRLSLWSEKEGYEEGDELFLLAAATEPCRLTVISVDTSGDTVVIFPSEFQEDNHLGPANPQAIPDPDSEFRLRVDEPGQEIIIGICLAGERADPPGILHDHELQPFTLLGDWEDHLEHALEADAAERRNAGKRNKRKRQRRRGRRTKQPPVRADKLPLRQSWALLVIPKAVSENGSGGKAGSGETRSATSGSK